MPQQFQQSKSEQTAEPEDETAVHAKNGGQAQNDALDAILDDIESTLETNAEEYVSSFVQKGGE